MDFDTCELSLGGPSQSEVSEVRVGGSWSGSWWPSGDSPGDLTLRLSQAQQGCRALLSLVVAASAVMSQSVAVPCSIWVPASLGVDSGRVPWDWCIFTESQVLSVNADLLTTLGSTL